MEVKSKRRISWFLSLIAVLFLLLSTMPLSVRAVQQGKFNDTIAYSLSNGILTLSGKGELRNGDQTFSNRTDIQKIKIENGITYIGESLFSGCTRVTDVEIADTVTQVGTDSFWGCRSLSNLKLSRSLKEIGGYAFSHCVRLQQVQIPNGTEKIGEETFNGCQTLQRITLPKSVEEIGNFAFYDCPKLTEVRYGGTKTNWQNMDIGSYNEPLLTAHIQYNFSDVLTNQSKLSATTITKGEQVRVTALASGGSGSYQYAVYYKQAASTQWTTVQNYRANNKIAVKPQHHGTYNICVKVRDSAGKIAKQYWTVTVKKAPLKNTSTLLATTITKGGVITVHASASGGSGSNQYAVYYKQAPSTKWTTVQSYKTNATITVKPQRRMNYNICVKVKDSSGTVAKQYFTVSVQ